MLINKYRFLVVSIMMTTLLLGCSESFDYFDEPSGRVDVTLEDPINDFVWKALNSWYYWQPNSEDLQDSKSTDLEEYYNFLNQYSNYETLMLDLCYKHTRIVGSQNAVDRFSWFIQIMKYSSNHFKGFELDLVLLQE